MEGVLLRLFETQEEQDCWLSESREAIQSKIRLGLDQLRRGEGIPEDQLDSSLAKLKANLEMSARYVLAPQAARDLVEIWQYIRKQSSVRMADHVESTIKEKFIFLSGSHGAGHIRSNLTAEAVKFFRFILTGRLPVGNESAAGGFDSLRQP